jgi:hypothetical protein
MKQINTLPIENYLEKTRIAAKSGQKTVNLDIKEATALADSLAVVMTRLVGNYESNMSKPAETQTTIEVSMDGGGFR